MGDAKRRAKAVQAAGQPCIFCGGDRVATTEEHCPPRALFKNKAWPVGYSFPACEQCNGGTSDADLMVAFLAHLNPADPDPTTLEKGRGLMRGVNKQFPGVLAKMFGTSATEARGLARRMGLRPAPGQTYQQIGFARVPQETHAAVGTLAGKLTRAIYFMESGRIFPSAGSIQFNWFTSAQQHEHGRIAVLEAFAGIAAMSPEVRRNGRDLADQFDYRYSASEDGVFHVLQVVFSTVFGFVTVSSPEAGRLEAVEDSIREKVGEGESPFEWLAGGPAARGSSEQP